MMVACVPRFKLCVDPREFFRIKPARGLRKRKGRVGEAVAYAAVKSLGFRCGYSREDGEGVDVLSLIHI